MLPKTFSSPGYRNFRFFYGSARLWRTADNMHLPLQPVGWSIRFLNLLLLWGRLYLLP